MRRQKRHEEHVSHDRWLISYADFITLLFAFFVVLYASSQMDKRKMGNLANSIQTAFQELGVFDASSSRVAKGDSRPASVADVNAIKDMLNPNPFSKQMKALQSELEAALAPEIDKHTVAVETSREGIVVSLREIGFYESGSANLRPSSKESIDRLAAVLHTHAEALRIEGHSDNQPIHNARFDSNWELSTARAADLVKLLVTRYNFDPTRMAASGYAEFHPVSPNDTPEGRARNRRVDVVILNPQQPERQRPEVSPAPSAIRPAEPAAAARPN
jgi:chemotaxis protein MotB